VFPQLSNTEWSFFLNEQDTFNADGSQTVSAVVTGYPPVNTSTSICNPPQVPVQAIVSNTGGYLIGPIQVYIEICAVDSTGAYSPASGVISASIPSGVTTGQITISGINWSNGTASWDLFAGTDHYSLTHQLSGSGTPPSIPIDSLPNAIAYAPPDFAASNLYIQAKLILHGGIIGEYVVSAASNTITIGGSLTGLTNNLAGYRILLIGRTTAPSTQLGIVTFTISSYVVNSDKSVTFTVDRNVSGAIIPGDVVVIQTQANISSATTIGDSNFNNAYGPGGVATSDVGSIVRIIAGKGRFQTRIITSVAGGTTYTVDHPWDVIPDSTSWFIVEEFTWRHTSSSAPIATGSYSTINSVLVKFDNSDHHTFLVQTLVEDPTGTLYSSEWRSPLRMIFIQGTQGTSLTAS